MRLTRNLRALGPIRRAESVVRATCRTVLLCVVSGVACNRPTAASFVPQLEVTLSALSREHAAREAPGHTDFDLRLVAWLRFTPNLAAQDIPARAEISADHMLLSCDPDDMGCIEEAAETESEVERLLGELE